MGFRVQKVVGCRVLEFRAQSTTYMAQGLGV